MRPRNGVALSLALGVLLAAASEHALPGGNLDASCGSDSTIRIDLDVDADRDGSVDDFFDEDGEDAWTRERGAIFSVRVEGTGPTDPAPLVVRSLGPALAPGERILLRVEEAEDLAAVRVLQPVEPEASERGDLDWPKDGTIEVTALVDPASPAFAGDPSGDVVFGIEGVRFAGLPEPAAFDGEIGFALELHRDGRILQSDRVTLRVAPWIALSTAEQSTAVFAMNASEPFLRTASSAPDAVGLDHSGRLVEIRRWGCSQWIQDHASIGYTGHPGGQARRIALLFSCGEDPLWPDAVLRELGVESFPFPGVSLERGGLFDGDAGGNLAVLPPGAEHPLGRIVIGDTASAELTAFLEAQAVQDPIVVPTRWLATGHLDEVIGFTEAPSEVVIADPRLALELLRGVPNPASALLFAEPRRAPLRTVGAVATDGLMLTADVDPRDGDWQYLRIVDDSASGSGAAGQVARIEVDGRGLWINRAWEAGEPRSPGQADWYIEPRPGDRFVLVEETRFWADGRGGDGSPAVITVRDLLSDEALIELNEILVAAKLDEIRSILDRAVDGLTFVPVPVLFTGSNEDFEAGRSARAFTPSLANFQPIAGDLYFPRPFGPPGPSGRDALEETVRQAFPNALFVDCWETYHRLGGGVHCGSLVLREPPTGPWW